MRIVEIFSAITLLFTATAVVFYAASSSRSKLKAAHIENNEVSSTLAANQTTSNPIEGYGTISGRVLDVDGEPVENVIVTAENPALPVRNLPRAETNRDGEFTIAGLTPGRYELYAKKEEDGYPRTEFNLYDVGLPNTEVTVYSQQTAQGITVRLGPKAALLTGQVVDAVTRQPLKHADITVRRVDMPNRFLRTGLALPVELGEFKLLVPSVAFTVKVTETGYKDWYYKSADEGQTTSSLLLAPNTTKHLLIALQRIKRAK
jgi:Carboxypeptidase regulatory-like domain